MQIIHDSSAKKPMQVVDDGKEEKLKAFDAEEALETISKMRYGNQCISI